MKYLSAVDNWFPDRPSGSARVAYDFASYVRDQGHEVTVLCNSRSQSPGRVRTMEGMKVVEFRKAPGFAGILQVGKQLREVESALRTHCLDESFDIIHGHTPLPAMGAFSLSAQRAHLYTVHSPVVSEQQINWSKKGLVGFLKLWFGLPILKKIEGKVLDKARRVHVLSRFIQSEITRFHPVGQKIKVLPHWIRNNHRRTVSTDIARQKLGWPESIPIIFTLRRHVPRMGLEVAIDAIAPFATENRCVFVVGGDGPLRKSLEARATALGASGTQVRFTGRLSESDLVMAYQAADLFVLPTVQLEGFGLIITEALAMGCPVLGTTIGAIPELLEPLAPEFLVEPDSVPALAQKVEMLLRKQLIPPPQSTIMETRFFTRLKRREGRNRGDQYPFWRRIDPPDGIAHGGGPRRARDNRGQGLGRHQNH
jgi:glycosyltransferase involved in cell wall biosynthesis